MGCIDKIDIFTVMSISACVCAPIICLYLCVESYDDTLIPGKAGGYYDDIDTRFESGGYYWDDIDTRQGRRILWWYLYPVRVRRILLRWYWYPTRPEDIVIILIPGSGLEDTIEMILIPGEAGGWWRWWWSWWRQLWYIVILMVYFAFIPACASPITSMHLCLSAGMGRLHRYGWRICLVLLFVDWTFRVWGGGGTHRLV